MAQDNNINVPRGSHARPAGANQGRRPAGAAQGQRSAGAGQGQRPAGAGQAPRAGQGRRPAGASQGRRPVGAAQGRRPAPGTQAMPQAGGGQMPRGGAPVGRPVMPAPTIPGSDAAQYSRYGGDGSHGDGEYIRRKRRKKHFGKGKIIAIVCAVVVLALGVSAGLLANSALGLRSQAQEAMQDVSTIRAQLVEGSYANVSATTQQLSDRVSAMNDELQSPLWAVASVVPVVGSDIQGVRTFVSAVDGVASDVLVPLTQALAVAPEGGIMTADGAIDAATLSSVVAAIEQTAPAMQTAADRIATVPTMNISQLEEIVGPVKEQFASLNAAYQQVDDIAPIIEPLLGIGEDRTYLLAAQNTAEIRSCGGFPGSMGTLHVSNGKISMGEFSKVYDVLTDEIPAYVSVSDTERALFTSYLNFARDAEANPDFPAVANIWAASYTERNGVAVDGVISITPSMVQDILKLVGSVTLSDGTELTGDNATKVLQHDLYWRYLADGVMSSANADLVDSLFAEAAGLSFSKLVSSLQGSTLLNFASIMMDGIEDREVMVWLTNPDEQQYLDSCGVSGALNDSDPASPVLGVFMGTCTPSKLGWYADSETQLSAGVRNPDSSMTYEVTTVVHNAITSQDVQTGGTYIVGWTGGDINPMLYIYAPAGGSIDEMTMTKSDGTTVSYATATYNGLQVNYLPLNGPYSAVSLFADESLTITYTVTTSPEAEEELTVASTPTLTEYRAG